MDRINRFNVHILAAVDDIYTNYAARGYDINSYFTHDLTYGPAGTIKANHPPLTMCVAAVAEIIVGALTRLYGEGGDRTPFDKLAIASWQRGTPSSIRAHIFMYEGTGSQGTAHALERFGIGAVVPFAELQPGDFINFNRQSGSGHACVFLGYLDDAGNDVAAFGPSVAGFRYFSAQGKNSPDAGFGFRWAFFAGKGPATLSGGRRMDRGIIWSEKPSLLCCGYMIHPAHWPAAVGLGATPGARALAPATAREPELPVPDLSRFDGVTMDEDAPARRGRSRTPASPPLDPRDFAGSLGIIVDLLPVGFPTRPGRQIEPTTITVHNTDNDNRGAGAAAHNRYIRGDDAVRRQVSWHFTVDDRQIFQHLPVHEVGFHAGSSANASSVAIEICMNSDMDAAAAYDRAARLCAQLSAELDIPVATGLRQHHDWTGKNCPRILRSTADGWTNFVALAASYRAAIGTPAAPAVSRGTSAAPDSAPDAISASIDRHFADHPGLARAPATALPVPEGAPIAFAQSTAPTRYWPVATLHPRALEVNALTTTGSVGSAPSRRFLADRQSGARYHVGLDVFCSENDTVLAIEDGTIVAFYAFYEGTHALLVDHGTYVANYGEVAPNSLSRLGLAVGAKVRGGQPVGTIGRLNMLHFETYEPGTKRNYRWLQDGTQPPERLRNPSQLLLELAASGLRLDAAGAALAADWMATIPTASLVGARDMTFAPGQLPVMDQSDWHRFGTGSREWRYDERGLWTRDNTAVTAQRWDADLDTMRKIVAYMGEELFAASRKHGIPPALLMMTVAAETHIYKSKKFTGPATFRWEAAVENDDVQPPTRGDYSAGPMQSLGTTARWVIASKGQAYGLPYRPFEVAPVFPQKPNPAPDEHPLYDYATNLDLGAAEIRIRLDRTGRDPIFVAAAYNTGGLYGSATSPWGLKAYGDHLDRAAKWYGDAAALLVELGVT